MASARARVLVAGTGVSGIAAARLARRLGCAVTVLDSRAEIPSASARLAACGAAVEWNVGADFAPPADASLAVFSPAFPDAHPWVARCRARGIETISELEFGARNWKGRILAVTGSKGKSSIVKLSSDALNAAGRTAAPAGNYGTPLCELCVDRPDLDYAVVEVSSFQMELTTSFSPDVALFLNLQADHLDRHGSMEVYRALKMRLFSRMRKGSLALLPEDFAVSPGEIPEGVECARFGAGPTATWRYTGGAVVGEAQRCDLQGSWFDNPVFGISAASAVAALLRVGLSADEVSAALRAFRPLAHRMQLIGTDGKGVRYIDDSKATSLAALAAGVRMAGGRVRLIAGGLLKEENLAIVKETLASQVEKVYLIGSCAERMAAAWGAVVPCVCCVTLDAAVKTAVSDARAGEAVLLSPGTASFDQFKSYGERGERFASLVRTRTDLQSVS